ncbi:hypothetical protein [Paenibacillus sp. 1001270B_150601_E10]|uniref:hypothetical protein n=1 Tax=Paenibacillus sp. 1001270B_150601_E10 TaxID=2787079 RepID=UPI00189E2EA6|nr:hypothetical protein [Paenibacillus sp. 1001270B_150601_E10]
MRYTKNESSTWAISIMEDVDQAYQPFVEACIHFVKGMRQTALVQLNEFVHASSQWPFEQRQSFTAWIMQVVEGHDADVLKYPLSIEVILPTLREWMHAPDVTDEVFLWLAKYYGYTDGFEKEDLLKRAIALNGLNQQRAIEMLCYMYLDRVDFSVHHLPDYYIGDPKLTLILLDITKEWIKQVKSVDTQTALNRERIHYKQLIDDWLTCMAEAEQRGEELQFAKWCKLHGRKYHWVKAYYYE